DPLVTGVQTCALPISSFASKVLPTTVFELNALTVLTVIVVPAGSVAAFVDELAMQPQITAITEMILVSFIFQIVCGLRFQSGVRSEERRVGKAGIIVL